VPITLNTKFFTVGILEKKGKWMFESDLSKCQSLLNYKEEVTWTRSGVLIIRSESRLSLAQGGFAQGNIILSTSSNDFIKKWQ
jgi:hypothetical protein